MRTFSYISREYVPSIDLTTLGQTYNTLEQGHQEAVKASSDLEAAVAQLDMNEAEDGFKQQLINEIKTTVDENSIYGNSYGALDDIIAKAGDIQSDGRVIGRLRSQKAKKEYDAKVDAMAIPEGMKQMYKEENPYYYEDGAIDITTGRVLPGELWTPTTNPVNTIADADIQKYALSIAAKEAGSGESISFLDANGNETYDPSQSVDGAFYRKVGTKYERLSKDKIRQAYQIAIDSIPGARDSLAQDYRYATYQYNKTVEKARQTGGDTTPFVPGYTDKDGNIYTEEQWLNNKINKFASVAAYNHTYSSIDFGTALQNRRAREAALATQQGASTNNSRLGSIVSGTEEVETNTFATVVSAKNDANRTGLNIIKQIASDAFKGADSISDIIGVLQRKGVATGPNTAAQYIIKTYGQNMTPLQKSQLTNALVGYVQANTQYKQLINSAGNDRDALMFSANVANKEFTPDNKYGKQIIDWLNGYYKNYKEAKFQVGSMVMESLKSMYQTDLNGLKQLGINISKRDDGNYMVSIDAQHRNLLPEFVSRMREADSNTTVWNFGQWLKQKFTTGVSKGGTYEYGVRGYSEVGLGTRPFTGLVNIYNRGNEAASKAEEKVGVANGVRSFNTASYRSFGSAYAAMHPEIVQTTGETLKQFMDRQDEQVDYMFASGNFSAGKIQYLDDAEHAHIDISKNQDAKNLIQAMYSDETLKRKIARDIKIPTGTEAGGTQGYKLVFTVPEGMGNKSFKEGERVSLLISGVSAEEVNFNPSLNPDVLASNAITLSKATGGNVEIGGYSDNLGYTDLQYNSSGSNAGKFTTGFMGGVKTLNENDAVVYSTAMFTLRQLKVNVYAGMYDIYTPEGLELLRNKITSIATPLATVTGNRVDYVEQSILNYISEPED